MTAGVPSESARPVTRAQRGFGPVELAALPAEQIRQMCHVLLLTSGAELSGYSGTGDFDEFILVVRPLWRPRDAVVRVFRRQVSNADLAELAEYGAYLGAGELVAVAPLGLEELAASPQLVHVISPGVLIDRIVRTPLVEWREDVPSASTNRLQFFLQLEGAAADLDPVGIQWLPQLALNEDPANVIDAETSPQDLLERKAFRIFTASFRFGGIRYGESARGQRLPDAVLHWPDHSSSSALLDCKAASAGYRMEADHLLRFQEYWDSLSGPLRDQGHELEYLLILSSFFPGSEGSSHPFHGRAEEIRERTGLQLVYLKASDLSWAAAQLEAQDSSPARREALDWHAVLKAGMIESDALNSAVRQLEE